MRSRLGCGLPGAGSPLPPPSRHLRGSSLGPRGQGGASSPPSPAALTGVRGTCRGGGGGRGGGGDPLHGRGGRRQAGGGAATTHPRRPPPPPLPTADGVMPVAPCPQIRARLGWEWGKEKRRSWVQVRRAGRGDRLGRGEGRRRCWPWSPPRRGGDGRSASGAETSVPGLSGAGGAASLRFN